MPEIRRRNENRLQIFFLGEQVLVILVNADFVAELLQIALPFAAVIVPDVAQGDQPDAFNVQQRLEEDLAFLAITDEGDIDGVQRRLLDGCLLFGRSRTCRLPAAWPAPATAVALINSRRFNLSTIS